MAVDKTYDRCIQSLKSHDSVIVNEVIVNDAYRLAAIDLANKLVIDVGANIGTFTTAALMRGAKVMALEPDRLNFSRLVELCWLVPDISRMTLRNVAIGDGRSNYVRMVGHGAYSKSVPCGDCRDGIKVVTLNKLAGEFMADNCAGKAILKLDCEGAEFGALFAASTETLRFFSTIMMEIHLNLAPLALADMGDDNVAEMLRRYMRLAGFSETRWEYVHSWSTLPDGTTINWKKLPLIIAQFDQKIS